MPKPIKSKIETGISTDIPSGYQLQLIIDDLDYTDDLYNLSIKSSLSTAYQIIVLELRLKSSTILEENILGSSPIKLSIQFTDEDRLLHEETTFELLYIKSDFQLMDEQLLSDRTPFTITTVCRTPYKTMTTNVNKIFIGNNLRQIVEYFENDLSIKIEYDSDGENKNSIDQVCIPPITFYKAIKEYNKNSDPFDGFLDQRFGWFNGVPGVFCQYDGTVYIKNLTAKMNKSQTFTLYQLAGDYDNRDLIESCFDGKHFYTFKNINTDFSANAKYAVLAPQRNYIVKPSNTLSYTISQNLSDVVEQYSCSYMNKKIEVDPFISSATRKQYISDDTGYERNTTQFNSRTGKNLSDVSTMVVEIEGGLRILNLMNVGEAMMFNTFHVGLVNMAGKYILWSSSIDFISATNWSAIATINLIRTNKVI